MTFSVNFIFNLLPFYFPLLSKVILLDLILINKENTLNFLELAIGFQTEIIINYYCNASMFYLLQSMLLLVNNQIKIINLSPQALATIGSSSESVIYFF